MAVISNLAGTSETVFRIGLAGAKINSGSNAPNVEPVAGTEGDIYIRVGTGTSEVYQHNGSDWFRLLDTRGGQTVEDDLTIGTGAKLTLPNGSEAAPSLNFSNATSTGLWLSDTDTMSISAGGIHAIEITPTTTYIKGDLYVQGTTTTVHSSTTAIQDNTILLNSQEIGAGVTLGTSGIEIERGSLSNVSWLFDESNDTWKPSGVTALSNIGTISTPSETLTVSATGALILPIGTTGQRPGSPSAGMLRFSSTLTDLEFYNGSEWRAVPSALGGFVQIGGDTMTGDLEMDTGARILLSDGSVSDPSLSFANDLDSGLFWTSSNAFQVTLGGSSVLAFTTTAITAEIPLRASAGSAGAPSISFGGDTDTGLYSSGANEIGIAANGSQIGSISTTTTSLASQTGGVTLPTGTTGQRVAVNGTVRYNSTLVAWETRVNGTWVGIASPATGSVSISGDSTAASSTGQYSSVLGGLNAKATLYGQFAAASGRFSADGDAQASRLIARRSTTDATPSLLFLDGSSSRLVIPNNTTWVFVAYIAARRTDGGGSESAGYRLEGCIANDAGTTALTGSVATTIYGEDSTTWDVSASADDANDALSILVTGEAAKTIHWVARIDLVEAA